MAKQESWVGRKLKGLFMVPAGAAICLVAGALDNAAGVENAVLSSSSEYRQYVRDEKAAQLKAEGVDTGGLLPTNNPMLIPALAVGLLGFLTVAGGANKLFSPPAAPKP